MIYVILTSDCHSDPGVEVVQDKWKAIDRARELAKEYCRFEEDYEEKVYEVDHSKILMRIEYSCEGDNVTIFEVELT